MKKHPHVPKNAIDDDLAEWHANLGAELSQSLPLEDVVLVHPVKLAAGVVADAIHLEENYIFYLKY